MLSNLHSAPSDPQHICLQHLICTVLLPVAAENLAGSDPGPFLEPVLVSTHRVVDAVCVNQLCLRKKIEDYYTKKNKRFVSGRS